MEQGDRAASQAGAWGLRLMLSDLGLEAWGAPGCWGGARRGNIPLDRGWALWPWLQALRLRDGSLSFPSSQLGSGMFGQQLEWLVCVCVFEGDSTTDLRLCVR